jgi:hypothetical protein
MQHLIPRRIADIWIGALSRGLLALALAVAIAALPPDSSPADTSPPPGAGEHQPKPNQGPKPGQLVNWNS